MKFFIIHRENYLGKKFRIRILKRVKCIFFSRKKFKKKKKKRGEREKGIGICRANKNLFAWIFISMRRFYVNLSKCSNVRLRFVYFNT